MFASKDILLAAPSGYKISRSVRTRASATAYFNRTPASATNQTTWTWSGWVKRGSLGGTQCLFCAGPSTATTNTYIGFSSDQFYFANYISSSANGYILTTPVYRDPSAWYHVVVVWNTTDATATNRLKFYLNGTLITNGTPTQNTTSAINAVTAHRLGVDTSGNNQYFDGYITEINFIDGQALTPSSFGEINPVTGVWQPKKYTGTYGTNGFYLNFSDNSAATAAAIGKDYSGNGNNWTPNNISVTAGATYDSMLDVPTPYADGGNGRGNYATLNPLDTATTMQASLASGNLDLNANTAASGNGNSRATIAVNSGKWYFEATLSGYVGSSNLRAGWDFAIAGVGTGSSGITGAYKDVSSNQTVIIAVDLDNLLAWVGSNGTWDAGDPSAGTGGTSISLSGYLAVPFVRDNSATAGNGGKWSVNFGQRPFSYTSPTGFKALNTQNLPAPTISNGAAYMAANIFTGNSATQTVNNSVNNVSFQPDLIWFKNRSNALDHAILDAVRGGTPPLFLSSNLTTAEGSTGGGESITYNSNGFAVISNNQRINFSGHTYVAWQWNAGNSTVTNTSGSISAQVRANPTAGFSVVTYTGNGSNGATVGHGLGVVPAMMIIKSRNYGSVGWDWIVYHRSLNTSTEYLVLNSTAAKATAAGLWSTSSSTFGFPTAYSTTNSAGVTSPYSNFVAYCFAAVAGYSAFGSYTGNGSTDGPFIYCGFRPRYFWCKRTDSTGSWQLHDTSRSTYNAAAEELYPNATAAEDTSWLVDFLSNGVKIRSNSSSTDSNATGGTYIFAAFAENPFKNSLAR